MKSFNYVIHRWKLESIMQDRRDFGERRQKKKYAPTIMIVKGEKKLRRIQAEVKYCMLKA